MLIRVRLAVVSLCAVSAALVTGCPPIAQLPRRDDANSPPIDDGNAPAKTFHEQVFTEILPTGYQGPASCQVCHANIAQNLLATGHWKWSGTSVHVVGHETETNGKRDLLSSFFPGVASNEARCSQCHPSYDYTDKTFDFTSPASVDCFVCHDTTGTYGKHPTAGGGGGQAALWRDGQLVLASLAELQREVVYNIGKPSRANCGACHFYADGGDNVKHGDLSSDLLHPTRDLDVHMGGLDFACQQCHTQQKHGLAGFSLHSVDEGGEPAKCTRCHGASGMHTTNPPLDSLIEPHLDRVACESCHIPTFARGKPTLTAWYWDTAGRDVDPIPTDALGQPTYDKNLGTLAWAQDVKPEFRWFNGNWRRLIVGVDDTYMVAGTAAEPVIMAEPMGAASDPNAKVHPFKKFVGRQPVDTVNRRLLVPHLFGSAAGPEAFWDKYDWDAALREGAAYTGVSYSGSYGFVDTVTYLRISHQIPPKSKALLCGACHGVPVFWQGLGLEDPLTRGQ
jgi:octaheme c-type cytochrome (tetrathionate reductase family)